ncbi:MULTISPECIES: Ig domain-containing protein [Microbacterium]|uniref:Ig domain-containing protein n=1 Tax=Microbacterium TaxID=33882 RepID=UPI00146C6141|nr:MULTISPECIES: Ig domain-containing protein [Microbacterium]
MTRKITPFAVLAALAATALFSGGIVAPPASATAVALGSPCAADPLLDEAQRAIEVLAEDLSAFTEAAAINSEAIAALKAIATKDDSLWLDECGKAFFSEPLAEHDDHIDPVVDAAAPAVSLMRPLSETFELESRPGSDRTIFLDFDGHTIEGTAWNKRVNSARIVAEAYSIDGDESTFSDAERTEIQRVWQIVSEDYAPFDVNVTTRNPGDAAITRSSAADLQFGSRVVITADPGNMQKLCGCGGQAYIGVFSHDSDHAYYQPALVYTDGVGTTGKAIGEATSHEVGHNFGLTHDGTPTADYSKGTEPWAPIMGVGYAQPVSQWSKGEYSGASNTTQDDLAVIAQSAPRVADDHGDGAAASAIADGQEIEGVIETRTDVDAFRFTGSGSTTITVSTPQQFGDLDVLLTVRNAQGAVVATVDPGVAKVNESQATGLGATWSGDLPAGGATYTATVDGIGTGDPLTPGLYSDYGSLGRYTISVETGGAAQPPAPVLAIKPAAPAAATVGKAYSATLATASGGTAPYRFSAANLPAGLSLDAAKGSVSGTPSAAGTFDIAVSVTDAKNVSAKTSVRLTVNPAPTTPPATRATAVASQSFSGKVGFAFGALLVATGGDGRYAWSVASGTLPAGLTLSPAGLLSGTPTTAGTFAFGAKAASAGTAATGIVTVTVAPKDATGTWTWSWSWSSTGGTGGPIILIPGQLGPSAFWTAVPV